MGTGLGHFRLASTCLALSLGNQPRLRLRLSFSWGVLLYRVVVDPGARFLRGIFGISYLLA